jgi:putative DNA primase/helicase
LAEHCWENMTDRIRSALAHIPAGDRALWVEAGMALHSELRDGGREIWTSWSMQAENYNAAAAASVWRSFKAGSITIASLYHRAIEHGWVPDKDYQPPSPAELQAHQRANAARDRAEAALKAKEQAGAARRARWILDNCRIDLHPYLSNKGFQEMTGLVWRPKDESLLAIPMSVSGSLVGVQLVSPEGKKKFLKGQRTSGAEFVIGTKGRDWLVEGYATGLSLRDCLAALKQHYRIHVCFSAWNLVKVAQRLPDCLVVADNDESGAGKAAAEKTGRPFWMSDRIGEDLNDCCRRVKLFKASQSIRKFVLDSR